MILKEKCKAYFVSLSGIPIYLLLNRELNAQGFCHMVLTTAILVYCLNRADFIHFLNKIIPENHALEINDRMLKNGAQSKMMDILPKEYPRYSEIMSINLILISQLLLLIYLNGGDMIILQLAHYIIQDILLFSVSQYSFFTIITYNLLSLNVIQSSTGYITQTLMQLLVILVVFATEYCQEITHENKAL